MNISQLCLDLKPAILRGLDNNSISYQLDKESESIVNLPNESDIERIKSILQEVLITIQNEQYAIADNSEDAAEIAILRKGDIEEVGLHLCSLCAMVFSSKEEKIVHERSHLFGF